MQYWRVNNSSYWRVNIYAFIWQVFVKAAFKIGVIYVRNGQKTEEDIFSNTSDCHSTSYERFLSLLGNYVTLKDFTCYCGGLDISENNQNGTHSIFTKYRDNEIMFHVSTLMPNCKTDQKHVSTIFPYS